MKFARYLEDTQTPEWKKAYIDYRGLKKRITAVRREQEGRPADSTPEHSSGDDPLLPNAPNRRRQEVEGTGSDSAASPRPEEEEADAEDDSEDDRPRVTAIDHVTHQLKVPLKEPGQLQSTSQPNLVPTEVNGRPRADSVGTVPISSQAPLHPVRRASTLRSFATRFRMPSFVGSNPDLTSSKPRLVHSTTMPNNLSASDIASAIHAPLSGPHSHSRTLREILPTLTPAQKKFFEKLDAELDKIESFYLDREKEAHERSDALKIQLQGLRDHRRAFYEAHPPSEAWTTAMSYLPFSPNRKADLAHAHAQAEARADHLTHGRDPAGSRSRTRRNATKQARSPGRLDNHDVSGTATPLTHASTNARPLHVQLATIMGWSDAQDGSTLVGKGKQRERFDPDEYTHAKKKLKKAVLEHYRMLELLNNYRILNITGFRKALKKFEKVTKLSVQAPYMKEKVETSSFASDDSVKVMLHDAEEQFAARFSRGDKKKAMSRLRGGVKSQRSHHPSTFRSGMLLGLAIPAFVDGLIKSYQHETHELIPGWDGLLFVYSIMLIPTLFACLVGVNISVWAKARINYGFIFELDVRTALNKHQYMELPLFLLATLLYAFYFSFNRVGAATIDPTTWPLIWLLLAIVVMINPLPIFRRSARYWLLRNFGKLLVSGTRRVEFADFWMGDQLCSLVFSLSNLYFLGCVYTGGHNGDIGTETIHGYSKHFRFGDKWRRCTTPAHGSSVWAAPFVLALLPLLVRLVQSVKRYADSKLLTHIINGGKYGMGIVYYACYYNWRHTGGEQGGVAFAFWVLFATVYACYAATWDYLMDWSLFKPHSRYPLLRPELLYSHKIVYYFAIVSNIIIRFIWVIYIPISGPNFLIRSFIAAFLEMLRRWQWNFIRLENEHLGNMDQYRVTREVPLPYSIDDIGEDSAGEDDMDEEAVSSKRSWRRKRSQSRAPPMHGGDLSGAHA